jgi:hypothetical protein
MNSIYFIVPGPRNQTIMKINSPKRDEYRIMMIRFSENIIKMSSLDQNWLWPIHARSLLSFRQANLTKCKHFNDSQQAPTQAVGPFSQDCQDTPRSKAPTPNAWCLQSLEAALLSWCRNRIAWHWKKTRPPLLSSLLETNDSCASYIMSKNCKMAWEIAMSRQSDTCSVSWSSDDKSVNRFIEFDQHQEDC